MPRFALFALICLVGCVHPRTPGGKTGKAPFASPDGLRVLIVEETENRPTLPKPQLDILTATGDGSVRKWLADNAIEWRIYDKDSKTDRDAKVWQEAMAVQANCPAPYYLAANGKKGFPPTPLPADRAATIAKLATVKGAKR
jgi:hypothetical protein